MKTIYIIRHGVPAGSNLSGRCISSTDYPISEYGQHQALQLQQWFKGISVSRVYSSPLSRCIETAQFLVGEGIPLVIDDCLREVSVGEWENMTFTEIRERYPQEYEARGRHLGSTAPPGGESFEQAGKRMYQWLEHIAGAGEGNIAAVSHSGAIRSLLCLLKGCRLDKVMDFALPYGSISRIRYNEEKKTFFVEAVGEMPQQYPSEESVNGLLALYRVSPGICAHGRAVCRCSASLADHAEVNLNKKMLAAAAQLHDICRGQGDKHALRGGKLLRKAGYPVIAEIIESHHDLKPDASPEAELLYLADKLIKGDKQVSLEERFLASKIKCNEPEAIRSWQRRYDDAQRLVRKYKLEQYV